MWRTKKFQVPPFMSPEAISEEGSDYDAHNLLLGGQMKKQQESEATTADHSARDSPFHADNDSNFSFESLSIPSSVTKEELAIQEPDEKEVSGGFQVVDCDLDKTMSSSQVFGKKPRTYSFKKNVVAKKKLMSKSNTFTFSVKGKKTISLSNEFDLLDEDGGTNMKNVTSRLVKLQVGSRLQLEDGSSVRNNVSVNRFMQCTTSIMTPQDTSDAHPPTKDKDRNYTNAGTQRSGNEKRCEWISCRTSNDRRKGTRGAIIAGDSGSLTPKKNSSRFKFSSDALMKLAKSPAKSERRRSECLLTACTKKPRQLRKSNKFKLYRQPIASLRPKDAVNATFSEVPCTGNSRPEMTASSSHPPHGPLEKLPGSSDSSSPSSCSVDADERTPPTTCYISPLRQRSTTHRQSPRNGLLSPASQKQRKKLDVRRKLRRVIGQMRSEMWEWRERRRLLGHQPIISAPDNADLDVDANSCSPKMRKHVHHAVQQQRRVKHQLRFCHKYVGTKNKCRGLLDGGRMGQEGLFTDLHQHQHLRQRLHHYSMTPDDDAMEE